MRDEKISIHFWRDPSGPEVDWLLHYNDQLLPIEVKWTDSPTSRDAKHLERFLHEYPTTKRGVVVCRTGQPQMLAENIEAISWRDLSQQVSDILLSHLR